MPFPIIIIDSTAPGSDTQASGAGPGDGTTSGSPLFGTNASTDGAGTLVTLDAGTDLTNVLVDGSHVVFINDTTSPNRNFGAITAKAGSGGGSPTVTVNTAFGAGLGLKAWAIGGKRLSFGGTTSRKLVDNVSTGDALPGWKVRFKSGHTETYSTLITCRRAGSAAAGRITIEGEAGAATMPTLTGTGNHNNLSLANLTYITVQNLRFTNTSGSKSSAFGVNSPGQSCVIRNCRCDDTTNYLQGLVNAGIQGLVIEDCWAEGTGSNAFAFVGAIVRNNFARGSAVAGFLDNSGSRYKSTIQSNIAVSCATNGLTIVGGATTHEDASLISGNTFHGNAVGIAVTSTAANFSTFVGLLIENNNLTGNSTYGLNFSGASVDDAFLTAAGTVIRYNNFGTGATANTSGDTNASIAASPQNSLHVDPGYADVANDDFSVGTALKALGWPQTNIGRLTTGTRSYVDVGAAQRQEVGSGGDQYLILTGV